MLKKFGGYRLVIEMSLGKDDLLILCVCVHESCMVMISKKKPSGRTLGASSFLNQVSPNIMVQAGSSLCSAVGGFALSVPEFSTTGTWQKERSDAHKFSSDLHMLQAL